MYDVSMRLDINQLQRLRDAVDFDSEPANDHLLQDLDALIQYHHTGQLDRQSLNVITHVAEVP